MGTIFGICQKNNNPLKDVTGQAIDLTKDFEEISESASLLPGGASGGLNMISDVAGDESDGETGNEGDCGKNKSLSACKYNKKVY